MSRSWDSHRISLSDMMTGLMLIFLLISVLSISQIESKERQKDDIVSQYLSTQNEIYQELINQLWDKQEDREMIISDDLTVRFSNTDILFDVNSSNIKPQFRKILSEFIPIYLWIINKDWFTDNISEVRIEWHTADCVGLWYMWCINLSQARSNSVLQSIIWSKAYTNLTERKKNQIKFKFMSIWMWDWRRLDINWDFKKDTDLETWIESRRVEFRIVTKSNEVIENIKNFNSNKSQQ